jgi:DNA-binding MarR family transcriptional regulator
VEESEMSVEATVWAFDQVTGSPLAKLMLISMADVYAPYVTDAEYMISDLAEFAEVDTAKAIDALDELAARGLLEWSTGSNDGLIRVRLNIPPPPKRAERRLTEPERATTYVYVMESGDLVKVGISRNVEGRRKWLSSAATAVEIAASFGPFTPATARKIEVSAHEALAAHAVRSEWFRVDRTHAIEAVRLALVSI